MPVFVADLPQDIEVAAAAWDAARACTGRDAEAADEVPIRRDLFDPDGPDGIAETGDAGLLAVRLQPTADNAVLAHEIAHAWIHEGEAWMVEGRTELLALCIAARIPEHVRFRHYGGQPGLPEDLRTWTSAAESFGVIPDEHIEAYYVHSQRLFEAIALLIPAERFWSEIATPEALVEELAALPDGETVLNALDNVRTQRRALADPDRDGLSTLYEEIVGTDPHAWDSDGDGFWDGAGERPEHAIVIPRDGSVVCSPWRPVGAETIDLFGGGNLHGHDVGGERWPESSLKRGVRMSPARFASPGGMWMAVEGDPLEPNPLCRVNDKYTLRDMTGALSEELAVLDQELLRFIAVVEEDFGPAPRRASIELTGSGVRITRVTDLNGPHTIRVPGPIVQAASELRQLDLLAAHVAAAFRFGFEPALQDMAAAAAFGWIATKTPVVGDPWVSAERELIRDWVKRARRCEEGWRGLAEWRCE